MGRPLCICGSLCEKQYGRGAGRFRKQCSYCRAGRVNHSYQLHKKDYCENCGFVALHRAQLDVDHIDGDRTNDNSENLRTLCANCHRLKTMVDRGLYIR